MESLDTLKFIMYGFVNNSLCLLGLSGNFLLLYIFIRYRDMRKQSINIYLTVLALYDNGVLIFSILMLNLPAITEYQQMAAIPTTSSSPSSSFPSSSSSSSLSNSSSNTSAIHSVQFISPQQTTLPILVPVGFTGAHILLPSTATTKRPSPDTGQRHWQVTSPNWLNYQPTTTSPLPLSSAGGFNVLPSFASSPSLGVNHPLRHQSTSTTPNSHAHHHRSKRTKRHLFPPQPHLMNLFKSCFNLSFDDLTHLKANMILLNSSNVSENAEPVNPQLVDPSSESSELVDHLFFQALLRQLILWIRLSLTSKLNPHPPMSKESQTQSGPSTISNLTECRRTLMLHFYSIDIPQNDQQSANDANHTLESPPESTKEPPLELTHANGAPSPSSHHPSTHLLVDDESTQVNLLLLSTLEDIYHQQTQEGHTQTTLHPNQIYASSLTGQEDNSLNGPSNESSDLEEDAGLSPPAESAPPQGSLYPLMYYVKIVYPLALISQSGSIWTTCLITIERYLAVCHPLMSLTLSTRSRAIWALCLLSAAAFIFNLPRFAEVDTSGDSIRPSDLRRNSVYYHVYYICLNLSLNYILPLCMLTWLNIKIYASVRHANAHRNELTRARQSELHLASMLVLIVAIFIACNAPAFLVNCMEPYFDVGTPLLEALTIFSNVLVCFNSAINFVIYCIFGKKFRSKLKTVFGLHRSTCLVRSDSTSRNGGGAGASTRNRFFSRRFSNGSRNSSFRLTIATHLTLGGVNGNLANKSGLTGNSAGAGNNQVRQYSYPHTALLPDTHNGHTNTACLQQHQAPAFSSGPENDDDCAPKKSNNGKLHHSGSLGLNQIPLSSLQATDDTREGPLNGGPSHYQRGPANGHFYSADTTALNTFV